MAIEGIYTADGLKRMPTLGLTYPGDVRMRLHYNPNTRNGTYAAMEICHQEFVERGRTFFSTDGGPICVVAFREEAFVVAEGHPGVFDYHMPDAVVMICKNSDEYVGPGISPDDYDEAKFVINPGEDELTMTWFAPEEIQ